MIISALIVLMFGTKLIGSLLENGIGKITDSLFHWYDDPTAFILSYLIGYAIIWWKPFLGGIIIIIASLLVFIININNIGFLFFALLTVSVGLLYMFSWYDNKKR